MNAKYFTAESREAAVLLAEKHFSCDREYITFDVLYAGDEADSCQLMGTVGTQEEVANMNAAYGIYFENDGVYLELYEERGTGRALVSDDLMLHLSRKNISMLDIAAVQFLVQKVAGRTKIAPPQQEYIYGEGIGIIVTSGEMQASAKLLAPEAGGAMLSIEAAKQKLIEAGVIHGIDEQALTTLLEEKKYGLLCVVAEATPAEDGADGKLIFNFSTDKRTGSPKEISGGRVDYRTLDIFVPVEKDQLLVTRTLATEGKPGFTVTGKELKQRPGKDIGFPKGKNVEINEEKTLMF